MTDNVLSQGWLAKHKSIMTTFNSIDNTYRIAFGNTIFNVEMAKDSLYYLSKEQVQQILTHVNHVTQHVKVDVTKVFTKEQLSSQRGETLTLCVATPL
jgi:hypothetical protein